MGVGKVKEKITLGELVEHFYKVIRTGNYNDGLDVNNPPVKNQ